LFSAVYSEYCVSDDEVLVMFLIRESLDGEIDVSVSVCVCVWVC